MPQPKHWSREDEDTFINYIRAHPSIWDRSHPDYNKRDLRAAQMREAAAMIGKQFAVQELTYKYQNWRSQLRREVSRMKNATPPCDREPRWRLYHKLSFLAAHITSAADTYELTSRTDDPIVKPHPLMPNYTPCRAVGPTGKTEHTAQFTANPRRREDGPDASSKIDIPQETRSLLLTIDRTKEGSLASPHSKNSTSPDSTNSSRSSTELSNSGLGPACYGSNTTVEQPGVISTNNGNKMQSHTTSDELTYAGVIRFCHKSDITQNHEPAMEGSSQESCSPETQNSRLKNHNQQSKRDEAAAARLDLFCDMLKRDLETLPPDIQEYLMVNTLSAVLHWKNLPKH